MSDKNEIVAFTFDDASGSLTQCYTRIKDSLPPGFNISRAVQNAVTVMNTLLREHPEYKAFGAGQWWKVFRQASILDLDIGRKEGYIVPYGNRLTFMTSYKGDKLIAKRYSTRPILDIHGYIVREGDDFSATQNSDKWEWKFTPKPFNTGRMVGAFAYVVFKDGGNRLEMMNLNELEQARSASKSKNSPAWNKFHDEMYRKIILHRICKHIDIDISAEQADIMLNGIGIAVDPKEIRDKDVENVATEAFNMDGVVYED